MAACKKKVSVRAIADQLDLKPVARKVYQRQSEHELAFKQTAMALKAGGQGLSKKFEVLKSLKDIDKRTNAAKNTVLKRSKGIRKP